MSSRKRLSPSIAFLASMLRANRCGCQTCLYPTGFSLLSFEHALAQGVAHQLIAVSQTEFLHDPFAVGIHRLGTDHELLGNLRAAIAFGHQFQHLALALGQAVERLL